jgi:hypothetical protein
MKRYDAAVGSVREVHTRIKLYENRILVLIEFGAVYRLILTWKLLQKLRQLNVKILLHACMRGT